MFAPIQCAGEETVGLYRQISTVKHPPPVIAVHYNSDKPSSTIVHVRMICDFVCDAADLSTSAFSVHTLVLVAFILVIFIYDIYYAVVVMMNVHKGRCGSVMWTMVTCTETIVIAAV